MRPVRLELNGFAGFRAPTVVDFTDTDYFALVGPTGSGKSTILDALTFALYGSAHRWGRSNAISYALAPTSNRCAVSLTFDIGSQRYQVAREVRRTGQQIQQKSVSLVQFTDSTAVAIEADGPQPEVLAGEIKELNTAVEQLLGLTFDDFCQCVVLPQGDFARFLSANARERQQILLKLLGAAQYEGIGKRAGAQAAEAEKEMEVLTDQLSRHADATPEVEATAQRHVTALEQLTRTVDQLVPHVDKAHARARDAHARADTLRSEADLLTSIRTPDGIEELQRQAAEAQTATQDARDAADTAAQTLSDATEAAQSGPQRTVLQVAGNRHSEKAALVGRRDDVIADAEHAQRELTQCEERLEASAATVAKARHHAEETRKRRDQVRQAHEASQRRQQLLAAVQIPDGVTNLTSRATALADQIEAATGKLTAARDHHEQASDALTAAGDGSWLTEAHRTLDELAGVISLLTDATSELGNSTETTNRAANAVTDAQSRLDKATSAADEARALAGAAQLRPQLQVGHACLVCEQNVTTLPPPLSDPALEATEAERAATADEHRRLLAQYDDAKSTVVAKQRIVDRLTTQHTLLDKRLGTLVPDRSTGTDRDCGADRVHLDELSASRDRLAADEQQARDAVRKAKAAHDSATSAATTVQRELSRARSNLHTMLGTLADLDPPAVDADDLTAAWAGLEAWARTQTATVEHDLAATATETDTAEQAHQDATTSLDAADRTHGATHTTHTAAVRDAATADLERTTLANRLRELDTLLDQDPPEDELPALFEECTRLEAAVEAATADATRTRKTAKAAAAEHQQWQTRTASARSTLTATRDEVAALEPPSLDTDDLAAAWAALTDWATRGASDRQAQTALAHADAQSSHDEAEQLLERLEALLRDDGLDPHDLGDGPERAAQAPRLVAVAAERARGQVKMIQRSLADAASTRDKIETARTRQQVAAELARLMRANKFPQWLADSALDTLVAGASQSLRQLSGDRFDLSHHKGEFYVIDHFDADSTRSVRTLSGGETFQASLSLALALSDQLAGLGGATKLESIFLDEGFGTLDADSLQTVADTLENLARGERMVGVITHVTALAEQIPVQYHVQRDNHTSVITRKGT
ncbi:AAA family ATPase [Streptomyces sp. SID4919]|uniref:AAA family ATPase n=1 Tax=unclassified Streptomyces TaxID=2593676 RepID=UPI0008239808|nr:MULTISPECIES: SMC family ATPase [unclassified Streptomyces]MYY13500.1 AAA family ATPase [Streptomyces sp. SID4919]SCK63143.1 exonuclease SbcC [Streptomyces sp. AmelKG-E11A]